MDHSISQLSLEKREDLEKLIEAISSLDYKRIIDSHCHLESESYEGIRKGVIERAISRRVVMVTTPLTMEERALSLELKRKYQDWIHIVTGSHPLVEEDIDAVADFIEKYKSEIVAIGEVGLDFKPPNNQLEIVKKQVEKFEFFIDLAKSLDLPLVVHSRSAGRQVLEVLASKGAERVLLHAFSGNVKYVRRGVQAGFFFTAPTTALSNPQKIRLVKTVPMEQLLLETDSPVLSPINGVLNEPSYVLYSALSVSILKELDVLEVIERTTLNAKEFFEI